MKFWDTSAVVPLLATESGTATASRVLRDDPDMIVWWGTRVECMSALARYTREHRWSSDYLEAALARLSALSQRWSEIVATEPVRRTAERIVRTHPLRAADALQLAAALVASDGLAGAMPFVSLDARQREAARREGFAVLPPASPTPTTIRERGHSTSEPATSAARKHTRPTKRRTAP